MNVIKEAKDIDCGEKFDESGDVSSKEIVIEMSSDAE